MFKIILRFKIFTFFVLVASNRYNGYLNGLNAALNYMKDNVDDLNIDAYFGVLLTNVYLKKIKGGDILWKKTLNLSEDILNYGKDRTENSYLINVEKYILDKNSWEKAIRECNSTLNCNNFYLIFENTNPFDYFNAIQSSPDELESDMCLSEIITISNGLNVFYPKCSSSRKCFNALLTGVSRGYSKTHRLLYFLFCRMEGCNTCGGKDTDDTIEQLCCDITEESRLIEYWNFPVEFRDLFIEQVVLCAISGYFEVLKPKWIDLIKAWQRPEGCWGYYNSEGINKGGRYRRSTTSLGPDACSSHTTALGVTALALVLDKFQCVINDEN